MERAIDLKGWNRREHFEFFNRFDEPFWGIVADVDCTLAYQKAKDLRVSFFLYYLHKSLQAANEIEEFRFRVRDGEVVIFDEIHASATIAREDKTFAFSFIKYDRDLSEFIAAALPIIDAAKASKGLNLDVENQRIDAIHYSSIPWIDFKGLTHARHFKMKDSCPKISFGQLRQENNRKLMAIALYVHHGFADGYQAGEYFKRFQELLNE